uniref:Kinesin-like protein KIN-7O n=1 Tax=Tanacetum cinerariifolium TaxID=118510 RepID=A0A699ICU0_TANCI|nr:kinesin-like protein KIN-7O [Tanacetum cinerariifolium]
MEKEFMHKKFDDATKKLKTELGSRGSEILNLKKQLALKGRSWPYTYPLSNNPPYFENEPDFPPANCRSGSYGYEVESNTIWSNECEHYFRSSGSVSSHGEGSSRFPVREKDQAKIRAPMAEVFI